LVAGGGDEIGVSCLNLPCIGSQKGDVILTGTLKLKCQVHTKATEVVSNVYTDQGLGGFFVGMMASFFLVCTIVTSQPILYHIIKQMLGLPATGCH
jgi:solute carrier family 25 phosphate transporter 3